MRRADYGKVEASVEPVAELAPERLRRRVDVASLAFDSTASVAALNGTIGQPRAVEALRFGLSIGTAGFNIFVTGMPASGRLFTVQDLLREVAAGQPATTDWVYLHNFATPDRPRAVALPPGRGKQLAADLEQFIASTRRQIAALIDSEDYQARRSAVTAGVESHLNDERREFAARAAAAGFAVQFGPSGIAVAPLAGGRPMTPNEIDQLPAADRETLDQRAGELRKQLDAELPRMRHIEREGVEELATLEREVSIAAVAPLLHALRERYGDVPALLEHFAAIEEDIPRHLADFRGDMPSSAAPRGPGPQPGADDEALTRYRANPIVDNTGAEHAPVVLETNPTYYNLLGRVEYRASFGAMVTDFTNVRAGSLHRANGGYLVINAEDLLRQPFAWDALKRALRNNEIAIENLAEQSSPIPTATLHPTPIPLHVKVILIAPPAVYQMLSAADESVRGLFKVRADFAPDMEWNDDNVRAYTEFISRTVARCRLQHFAPGGVARVVEHGARMLEDQRKLSTKFGEIADVAAEASYWAQARGHDLVDGGDVGEAVKQRRLRSNLAEERLQEMILEHTIDIQTEGDRVGQVNGLMVLNLGDYEFGIPARVTAGTSVGRGRVLSVDRESKLSGPIHSKGFLILSGYLAEKYAQESPLPIQATITFEQSYAEVEGDSASSAELYAILSSLSGLPVRQDIAVTGSVDQRGDVQAVGGVTEKVEGFFRVCAERGLSGTQGVMVPASNVENLMLDDDVVDAVAAGTFHVWPVRSVDEGIELLTGHAAGVAANGEYPAESVHRLVADRVRDAARRMREFASTEPA